MAGAAQGGSGGGIAAVRRALSVRNVVLASFCFSLLLKLLRSLRNSAWFRFFLGLQMRRGAHALRHPTGCHLLADALKSHGVTVVFTTNDHKRLSPLLKEIGGAIQVIPIARPGLTVAAADAYFRTSGRTAVALLEGDADAARNISAIFAAQRAHSNVLVLHASSPLLQLGRTLDADLPLIDVVSPHINHFSSVPTLRAIAENFERSFGAIKENGGGVAVVEVPEDLLRTEQAMVQYYGISETSWHPSDIMRRYKLMRIYATDAVSVRPAKPERPQKLATPTHASLRSAIDFVVSATRPIVFVGSETLYDRSNIENVRKALELLQFPVVLLDGTQGLLGREHPLVVGLSEATRALPSADLVMLLGVSLDERLQFGSTIGSHAIIVAAGQCKQQLTRTRQPHLTVVLPPGAFITALSSAVKSQARPSWLGRLHQLQTRTPELQVAEYFAKGLNEALGGDDIVICDTALASDAVATYVRPSAPFSVAVPGPPGTMGATCGGFVRGALAAARSEAAVVWVLCDEGSSTAAYTFGPRTVTVIFSPTAQVVSPTVQMTLDRAGNGTYLFARARTDASTAPVRVCARLV